MRTDRLLVRKADGRDLRRENQEGRRERRERCHVRNRGSLLPCLHRNRAQPGLGLLQRESP